MYKELTMIAVSSDSGVHLFDYESTLTYVKTIEVPRVVQVLFVGLYAVLVQESEDATEAKVIAY